jgi:hypothetical protein
MSINLSQVDELVRSVHLAGAEPARLLGLAEDTRSSVFDALLPYSAQFGDGLRTIPTATREQFAERLAEASRIHGAASAGIDQAFGAGTWMSDAATQRRAFFDEAHRVLTDPTLGPDSADHAIDLLRPNGYAVDQARFALRDGDLARLTDTSAAEEIVPATAEAFASSAAHWRALS